MKDKEDFEEQIFDIAKNMWEFEKEEAITAKINISFFIINLSSFNTSNEAPIYIEVKLPEEYDISQVTIDTLLLQVADSNVINAQSNAMIVDNTLVVKFDRDKVKTALNNRIGDSEFIISGKMKDGKVFRGSQVIKVIKVF